MAHTKSLGYLASELKETEALYPIKSKWIHSYSREQYKILGHTILESSEEVAIIYRSRDEHEVTFTRPAREWEEVVTYAGVLLPRFVPATSSGGLQEHAQA